MALEHYEREVRRRAQRVRSTALPSLTCVPRVVAQADSMADQFRTVNAKVAVTGKLSMRGHNLFKVVALQNQIMSEITQRLNILDRYVQWRVAEWWRWPAGPWRGGLAAHAGVIGDWGCCWQVSAG